MKLLHLQPATTGQTISVTSLLGMALLLLSMSSPLAADEVYNNLDAMNMNSWWGAGPLSDPNPDAGPDRTSQQFDLRGNNTVTEVGLQLFRAGTPTGSVTFEIWEDDGSGYPGQRVGTLGSIEDISTFEPSPMISTFEEFVALPGEATISFDTVVSNLNPALLHHVVIDYSAATGGERDGIQWVVAGGEEGTGPETLAVTTEFPALTVPLEERGFGATPDLFSSNGEWIRQSDMPSFGGAPPAVAFGNFKMSVSAVPELIAGDANLDNEVNFADFMIVSENFGQAGAWREGDFDGDGTTDFPDFLILSKNYGSVAEASVSAAAVPEPTASSIALLGLLGLIGFRKRR